jgi:hypothetical protein
MRIARFALALAYVLPQTSWAQCVMCNRTAAAQNLARAAVLNNGILILFVPPCIILGGFTWFALRRARRQ